MTRIWVGVWQWRNLFFSLFDSGGIIKGIVGWSDSWAHSIAVFWLVVCNVLYTTDVNFNIIFSWCATIFSFNFSFDFSDWCWCHWCNCNWFHWCWCCWCCLAFSLVDEFMLFQCEWSSESLVTNIALECFDFCMCLLMWFQIWNLAKCSSTDVTLVWFLSYKLFCYVSVFLSFENFFEILKIWILCARLRRNLVLAKWKRFGEWGNSGGLREGWLSKSYLTSHWLRQTPPPPSFIIP